MGSPLLLNSSSESLWKSGSGNGLLLVNSLLAEFLVEPLAEFFAELRVEFRVLIFVVFLWKIIFVRAKSNSKIYFWEKNRMSESEDQEAKLRQQEDYEIGMILEIYRDLN